MTAATVSLTLPPFGHEFELPRLDLATLCERCYIVERKHFDALSAECAAESREVTAWRDRAMRAESAINNERARSRTLVNAATIATERAERAELELKTGVAALTESLLNVTNERDALRGLLREWREITGPLWTLSAEGRAMLARVDAAIGARP